MRTAYQIVYRSIVVVVLTGFFFFFLNLKYYILHLYDIMTYLQFQLYLDMAFLPYKVVEFFYCQNSPVSLIYHIIYK